jgi:hypothetical protein
MFEILAMKEDERPAFVLISESFEADSQAAGEHEE